MRAVLPGKPQAKLQALTTALWDGKRLVAYITGNGIAILDGPNSLLQTLYLDQCESLDAVCLDERSGKIVSCSRDEIYVHRPYGREEGFLKWSLQFSLLRDAELTASSTLSWGSQEELLVGSSSLRLYQTAERARQIWDCRLPRPVKIASFSPDACLIASTGYHDRLIKMWRRQSFDSDDTRFDFSYLFHPTTVTYLAWRETPPHEHHFNEQNVDHVLYSVCADGKVRVWAATDPHGLQAMQLWAEIDMQQVIQPRRLGVSSAPQERYAFFINSQEFNQSANQILHAESNTVEGADHAIDHLSEIAKKKPDVCVVLDRLGNMSAWGLESVGCKTRKGTEVFNIAHIENFNLPFAHRFEPGEDNFNAINFANDGSSSTFSFITHFFDGRISWHESTLDKLFDPSIRVNRLDWKAIWTGHRSPLNLLLHDSYGEALLSRSDDYESIFWSQHKGSDSSLLVPKTRIPSLQLVQHSCILARSDFIINLHADKLSLWDTAEASAREVATLVFKPEDSFQSLIELDTADVQTGVRYVAGIKSGIEGCVWKVTLPRSVSHTLSDRESKYFWIEEFCVFKIGPHSSIINILPVDAAGMPSATETPSFNVRDVALAYDRKGTLTTWAANVNPRAATVDWHETSVIKTNFAFLSLASMNVSSKVALVDATRHHLTVWDTLNSHLEYTMTSNALQTIQDLKWVIRPSGISILAVSFPYKVVVLAQTRFDHYERSSAWIQIREIAIKELTSFPISHIAWLNSRELVIGAGNQLFVPGDDKVTTSQTSSDLEIATGDANALDWVKQVDYWNNVLPLYHPHILDQFLLAGRFPEVNGTILALHETLKYYAPGDEIDKHLSLPLSRFYGDTTVRQEFIKSWYEIDEECDVLTEDRALSLCEILEETSLPHLTSAQHQLLLHTVRSLASVAQQRRSIDEFALRYYAVFTLNILRKTTATSKASELTWRESVWGLHSGSHDVLVDLVSREYQGELTWERARASGMFLWLMDSGALQAQLEIVARNEYTKTEDKNPINCSLFYLALRKKSVLLGLWRMAHGFKEQVGTQKMLKNNFNDERWKSAALKNAYALLGKRRFEYAAAWFLLADRPKDAVNICVNQIGDIQLAIAVARVYGGDDGPVFRALLKDVVLPEAATCGNRWQAHWAFWMLRKQDLALRALLEPLEDLVTLPYPPNLEAKSYLAHEPALLIQYCQLRDQRLQARKPSPISLQAEWKFVLQTARQYRRMGCDMLALDLVRNWKFVEQPKDVYVKDEAPVAVEKKARLKSRRKSSVVVETPKSPQSPTKEKPKPTTFKEPEANSLLDSFGF